MTQDEDRWHRMAQSTREFHEHAIRLHKSGLLEEAVQVAQLAARGRQELVDHDGQAHSADLARSLGNLGRYLYESDRAEEALAVTRRAATLWEKLAGDDPDVHLPSLARILITLSMRVEESGNDDVLIELLRRIVSVLEELARRDAETYLFQLARALGKLARRLSKNGSPDGAVQVGRQAVARNWQLLGLDKGEHLPHLARSLGALAIYLSRNGQPEEALHIARQALAMRETLARRDPDQYASDLARSFASVANQLSENNQRKEALDASQRAADILQALVSGGRSEFLPLLASSLGILARRQSGMGRRKDALQTALLALGLYEELARADPETYQPGLVGCLNNVSARLSDNGDRDAALDKAQEAVAICRQVAVRNPKANTSLLAGSLNNLSSRLAECGRDKEALDLARQSADMREEFVRLNADAHLPEQARSLNNLANRLSENGLAEQALGTARMVVAIREELVRRNRDAFLQELASSLANLAVRLAQNGAHGESLATIERSIEMQRELVQRNADAYLPDLASNYHNLAIRLAENDRPSESLSAAHQAAELLLTDLMDQVGDWGDRAARVCWFFDSAQDLRADGLLRRLFERFLQRTDVMSREAFNHELKAFERFGACCVQLAAAHLKHEDATVAADAAGLLDQIVSALHSRDIRAMLLAEQEAGQSESHVAVLGEVRQEIVRQSLAKAALVEQSARPGLDSALRQGLREEVLVARAQLDRLRDEHAQRFAAIAREDASYAAASGRAIGQAEMQTALANLGGSAWLILLTLPAHGEERKRIVAVWNDPQRSAPLVVKLPKLLPLVGEHEKQPRQAQTLNLYARALRRGDMGEPASEPDEESPPAEAAEPLVSRLDEALLQPLRDAGISFEGMRGLVLCSHGAAHALPFAMLPEFRRGVRLVHYPGLAHALAAAARQHCVGPDPGSAPWVLADDAAIDTALPLPMTLVERELVRAMLDPVARMRVQLLRTPGEVHERFGRSDSRAAVFVAMCHGHHLNVHDSQLHLGGAPLKALEVLGWRSAPGVALLPVCLVGRARDDERGNAMGLVSALMIKGAEIVVGYTHPVADALAPWLTSLVVWHMTRGVDAWTAAHRARDEFERQDWPDGYREQIRKAMRELLPRLMWGGRPPGELVQEVQQRNERVTAHQLREVLLAMSMQWPWEGRHALEGLLADQDEAFMSAQVQAVCDGLFTPREDIKEALAMAMAEHAGCLQVFGRARA